MKVLITIGTMTDLTFTRLFSAIDELCAEGVLDGGQVTAQMGSEPYVPRYFKSFEMIEDDAFKQLIQESDLIITHAGTGTVTSCLKQGKKVIIFPRFAKYQEHYDDHQLELCAVFSQKNYVLAAINKEELRDSILRINEFQPQPFLSNNSQMNRLIINYIEHIAPMHKKKRFFSF